MQFRWLVATAVVAFASAAHAQMVTAQDPQSVVAAMQAVGRPATLGLDNVGDPKIDSVSRGMKFVVLFYNCKDHRACATVQFHSGFDTAAPVTLDQINAWNRSQRFGRAFLDATGDPVIQMDVDLDDGGMSRALFADNLEFWDALLSRFSTHIGASR